MIAALLFRSLDRFIKVMRDRKKLNVTLTTTHLVVLSDGSYVHNPDW